MRKKETPTVYKIFLVDDHSLVRFALQQLINKQTDMTVCGEAEDSGHALQGIATAKPDLVIADISLKESSGVELIRNLKVQFPKLVILVVSMHDESVYAEIALRAGAHGYIMKEQAIEKVLDGIRETLKGGMYLSPAIAQRLIRRQTHGDSQGSPLRKLSDRQLEVFRLLGQWKGTSQIAKELNLSVKTVEYYREQIKQKLNLTNSAELMQAATNATEVIKDL